MLQIRISEGPPYIATLLIYKHAYKNFTEFLLIIEECKLIGEQNNWKI